MSRRLGRGASEEQGLAKDVGHGDAGIDEGEGRGVDASCEDGAVLGEDVEGDGDLAAGVEECGMEMEKYLSPRPLFFLSNPLKGANTTSTLTHARSSSVRVLFAGSAGLVTVQMTFVLPVSTYDDPYVVDCVDICALNRRSSFQRRPSMRRSSGDRSS
ncbi:hypothetical protein RUND412_011182 [Rhizina undulata]